MKSVGSHIEQKRAFVGMFTRCGSSICQPVVRLSLLWCLSYYGVLLKADEYTLKGTVTSVAHDIDGTPRISERASGVPAIITCDFVWYRKAKNWRLDIRQPDDAFPTGVWKSIMPFAESNLISVIRYPPRPGNSNSQGNAFVTVMTNNFLPAQHIYGAHAIWLTFNLEHILTMFGPEKNCPPFWDYDPTIHALPVRSHTIIPTNGSVVFYNPGHYFARDGKQNVIFSEGQPKFLSYPFPLNKGFVEAEFQPSADFLDEDRRIPKRAELKYWTPLRDEANPNGVRLVMLSKLIVESRLLDSQPVPQSIFAPAWTNKVAVVVDFREKTAGNHALIHITKDNQTDPGIQHLETVPAMPRVP
jgi:hypothetical protein